MPRSTSVVTHGGGESTTAKVSYASETEGSSSITKNIERAQSAQSSCAGASSGDFHLYRRSKRRENYRLMQMEIERKETEEKEAFAAKLEKNKKEAEEKTARKREKRQKRKARAKASKILKKRRVGEKVEEEELVPLPKNTNLFVNDGSFLAAFQKAKAEEEKV